MPIAHIEKVKTTKNDFVWLWARGIDQICYLLIATADRVTSNHDFELNWNHKLVAKSFYSTHCVVHTHQRNHKSTIAQIFWTNLNKIVILANFYSWGTTFYCCLLHCLHVRKITIMLSLSDIRPQFPGAAYCESHNYLHTRTHNLKAWMWSENCPC